MNGDYILLLSAEYKKWQEELINRFERELELLPKGGLCRKIINGNPYYYHTKQGDITSKQTQAYIFNQDPKVIISLKRRKFIEKSLNILYKNKRMISIFQEKFIAYEPSKVLSSLSESYKDFDYKVYYGGVLGIDHEEWTRAEFDRNNLFPERLVYGTIGGIKVRSKSESLIANLLEKDRIPFRYEAALQIGETTYYPDFTIMRPKDKKIIYWEHFGMADDGRYAYNMEAKLSVYRNNGITQWDQLITTFETEKSPLDALNLQKVINAFLL